MKMVPFTNYQTKASIFTYNRHRYVHYWVRKNKSGIKYDYKERK